MRLSWIPLVCFCLAAVPAWAADNDVAGSQAAALDLMLPQAPVSPYRNDPPGTWYGDTSGVPPVASAPASAIQRRVACPTAPDGQARDLTGSVTAGVGYSSDFGNSNYQAADLNYCKTYLDNDGDERTINVQMHMGTYDGPGGWGPGPWPGPRRPGLP